MKNMVVIGATGTGKSTLSNVLAGRSHDDDLFPVGGSMTSCTNKTTGKKVDWRGQAGQSFYMIDTPGLNDPEPGRDSLNIAEMVEELKKLKDVNVFLIAFNGSDPRFNNSLIAMIKIFQNMFGREFLEKNTVFEFTNWSHDKASVRRRGTSKTEAYWAGELNKQLKELFAVPASVTVPAVFIDSLWDKEEPAENAKFEEEMGKLWAYLNSFPAYACEGFEAVKVELDELKDNIDSLQREKDEAEAARREMEKLNVEEVGSAESAGGSASFSNKLTGVHFDNNLDVDISDIEVTSCISDKYAGSDATGIFSYATDFRTMDTTSSKGWQLRQKVKFDGTVKAGGKGRLLFKAGEELRFSGRYRHYWMVTCKIGGLRHKVNKDNAQVNVWDGRDEETKPTFSFIDEKTADGSIRLNMTFASGTAHFYMVRC